jgi:hypothetical protein
MRERGQTKGSDEPITFTGRRSHPGPKSGWVGEWGGNVGTAGAQKQGRKVLPRPSLAQNGVEHPARDTPYRRVYAQAGWGICRRSRTSYTENDFGEGGSQPLRKALDGVIFPVLGQTALAPEEKWLLRPR